MKLYYHPFSQHSRRVRIVCHELALEPELVLVALDTGEHKTPDFMALNPAHAVPVLQDADYVLAESHAIMRYLCLTRGGDRLYAMDPARRAWIDQWLDWNHVKLNPPVQTLAMQVLFAGPNRDDGVVERARREIGAELAVLESGLKARRGIGGEVALADISIGTTLALYELSQEVLKPYPTIERWYGALKGLPSFQTTAPPR
jgi:glutathione S-transferase